MNAPTVIVKCKCCRNPFVARVADRKRGWGKFCSKSCKAIRQTQKTGYAGPSRDREYDEDRPFQMSVADLAMGGYGDSDPYDGLPVGHGKW